MAVHKLQINEFINLDYELIAIRTDLEDYKLAFWLNKILDLQLKNDLNIELQTKKGKSVFSHFFFEDTQQDLFWHLISNKSQVDTVVQNIGFFNNIETVEYLLPEVKTADFILKIENTDTFFNSTLISNEIKKIQGVITPYIIKQTKLKSKNNLIF